MKGENFPMTEGNKNYEADIRYAIQLCDYLLLMLGVWPFSKNTGNCNRPLLKYLVRFVCYALLIFFVVPAFLYLFLIEKSLQRKLRLFPLMFYNCIMIAKYNCLHSQESKIARCMKHVKEDWRGIDNNGYRMIMKQKAKLGRQMILFCGILMCTTSSFHRLFVPLSRGKIVTPLNVTIRALPTVGYYMIFDPQISPNYEIVFFLHCTAGLVTCMVITSICGLATLFVMHACGQLEILISLMKDIVDTKGIAEGETHKRLSVMVEHQNRVRNFLKIVQSTMQQVCLYELMSSIVTTVFVSYCLMMDWGSIDAFQAFAHIFAISSVLTHIFIFCFVGEQLGLQSDKVYLTSCILEWYRLPNKTAMSIILIVAISRTPMKLTAGNVVDLSLQTFGQVVKTAAAYCNILRTVAV